MLCVLILNNRPKIKENRVVRVPRPHYGTCSLRTWDEYSYVGVFCAAGLFVEETETETERERKNVSRFHYDTKKGHKAELDERLSTFFCVFGFQHWKIHSKHVSPLDFRIKTVSKSMERLNWIQQVKKPKINRLTGGIATAARSCRFFLLLLFPFSFLARARFTKPSFYFSNREREKCRPSSLHAPDVLEKREKWNAKPKKQQEKMRKKQQQRNTLTRFHQRVLAKNTK